MDMTDFELDDTEVDEITRVGPHAQGSSLPALYHLCLFAVSPSCLFDELSLRFAQREVIREVGSLQQAITMDLALDSALNWVNDYLEQWKAKWCPADLPRRLRWHLIHDSLGTQILLASRIAKARFKSSSTSKDQAVLLQASLRIFVEALESPPAPHMSTRASMYPYIAAIVLRGSDRVDLVLRLALRMAGDPNQREVPTCVRGAGRQMLAMLW